MPDSMPNLSFSCLFKGLAGRGQVRMNVPPRGSEIAVPRQIGQRVRVPPEESKHPSDMPASRPGKPAPPPDRPARIPATLRNRRTPAPLLQPAIRQSPPAAPGPASILRQSSARQCFGSGNGQLNRQSFENTTTHPTDNARLINLDTPRNRSLATASIFILLLWRERGESRLSAMARHKIIANFVSISSTT
jgi:hypothetical protein